MAARPASAGATAASVALGVGELAAGAVRSVPSPLDAVGQLVIPAVPGPVTRWAIETFGLANRTVLLVGTVAVAVLAGAAAGLAARRSFFVPLLAFAGFGLLGVLAALRLPEARPVPVVVAIGLAVAAGLLTLRRLAGAASPSGLRVDAVPLGERVGDGGGAASPAVDPSRRAFLRAAVGFGAAAVITAGIGRFVLTGGRVVDTAEAVALPRPARALPAVTGAHRLSGIPGLTPILTPNDDFYRIDTAVSPPQIDPDGWTLTIHGLVDREVELRYDDLLARPLVEVDATIACVSNEVGGDLVGTARWLGVPLADLLDEAGVRPEAGQVVGRAVNGWTAGFPVEVATDGRPALVAVGMNGEPLPVRHGFPARLVVPGLFGYVSATKWLSDIELTTWDGFDAYWVPRGWAKEGPIKAASRIDVPAGGTVPVGATVAAGVAWAPRQGVRDVEVQVDDGAWERAELSTPLSGDTWVQWRHTVELAEGEHTLRVRTVDADGRVQPEGPRRPAPDGAEGWHEVRVRAA